MASLEDVAKLASPFIAGINWDKLAKKGANTIWKEDYIYDDLLPAYDRAKRVIDSLDINVTGDEAFGYFKDFKNSVDTVKDIAWETALKGMPLLNVLTEMKTTKEVLRANIAIAWYTALYGGTLHTQGLLQKRAASDSTRLSALVSSGKLSAEKAAKMIEDAEAGVVRHAVLTTATFQIIALLDEWHLLDGIKKGATSGVALQRRQLGLGPVAVIGIIALSAAAVAVLCFLVISIADISSKNRAVAEECAAAREAGDEQAYQDCLKALKSVPASIADVATQTLGDVLKSAVPWIVGGSLLVLGVAFLPAIVGKVREAHHVARA